MLRGIFVTGTDTGVGKSLVCGCLARYLLEQGLKIVTQKWIQTGCTSIFSSDIKLHLKIMGWPLEAIKEYLPYVLPYLFSLASSPHLASRIEKRRINPDKIIRSFSWLSRQFDLVIVEGTGGVLVPFNQRHLIIDIVKELNLAVLVVVANRLGAINHTLLTIEALEERKMNILGLVFNNLSRRKTLLFQDNPRIIKKLTGKRIFGILPYVPNYTKPYEEFIPIGDSIWRHLRHFC